MQSVVEQVSMLVEDACKSDTNVLGYPIWSHHIVHVVRYARLLAKSRGYDEELAELGALLHDYAAIKDNSLAEEHHVYGAKEAGDILSSLGYPKDKIELVKIAIIQHRGSRPVKTRSGEGQILADADAMAHFDGIPSLLYYQYVKGKKSIDEGVRWLRGKLENSWKKLSPEAKLAVKEKYEASLKILAL
jgi:uncharacterized protein